MPVLHIYDVSILNQNHIELACVRERAETSNDAVSMALAWFANTHPEKDRQVLLTEATQVIDGND